jgi:uncharacterized protein YsxB (DUF464 family)
VIRITAVEDTLDDEGGSTLIITGHANEKVCAGVSALWATFNAGLAMMAKQYPRQISYQLVSKKKSARR